MATAKKTPAKKPATVKKKPVAKKPKLGRPPRALKAATSGIVVRLTAEEREALDAAAQRAGKSLSVFVRDAILSLCEKS
jgi:predicted HicB family RNase H-like nuclease